MNPRDRHPRTALRTDILAAILAAAGGLSGCYEHVISAKGVGSDRVDITKPNVTRDSDRVLGYPKVEPRPMPGSQ